MNTTKSVDYAGKVFEVDADADVQCMNILRESQLYGKRIVLDYGDIKTGKSWGETNGVTGYIGNSTGTKKIFILLHNSRSRGGGAILTGCILSIKASKGKRTLYTRNVQS